MTQNDLYRDLAISLIFSVSFAFVILSSSYGIYYLITSSEIVRIPYQYFIFIFAIYFIAFSVVVEHRGALHLYSILGGLVLSSISIFLTISVIYGLIYLYDNPGIVTDFREFLSIFGICMIIGYVIFKILIHRKELNI